MNIWRRLVEAPPGYHLLVGGAIFVMLSLPAMIEESTTFDEGVHLAAGYATATRLDYRLNPEHPPLAKSLAGAASAIDRPNWPDRTKDWANANQGAYGFRFLYTSGNDPDRLLILGRSVTLFWSLLLLFTVYAISRDLFGPLGGLLSLTLAVFSPTLLAHGHLVTTDVAVAALLLLSVEAFRRFLAQPSITRGVAAGLLLGGTLGVKFSGLILLPVLVWMLFYAATQKASGLRSATGVRLALASFCFVISANGTLWGLYGLRFPIEGPKEKSFQAQYPALPEGAWAGGLELARHHRLVPEAYLLGLAVLKDHELAGHGAFALGMRSHEGWWWYFPLAFLVKTPVGTLCLMAWGVWVLMKRRRASPPLDHLVVPVLIYGWLAVSSALNIGIRHLIPVLPIFMIFAGAAPGSLADWISSTRMKSLVLVFLGATGLSVLLEAPHYLAYFNVPSRLLVARHDLLADSNLDWGQDLRRLKRYMERHKINSIKLAYFGAGSPASLDLQHEVLPGNHNYVAYERNWANATVLEPGDIVAVSASHWAGLGLEDINYYRRRLVGLKPKAIVGRSILIFHLPSGWSDPVAPSPRDAVPGDEKGK